MKNAYSDCRDATSYFFHIFDIYIFSIIDNIKDKDRVNIFTYYFMLSIFSIKKQIMQKIRKIEKFCKKYILRRNFIIIHLIEFVNIFLIFLRFLLKKFNFRDVLAAKQRENFKIYEKKDSPLKKADCFLTAFNIS